MTRLFVSALSLCLLLGCASVDANAQVRLPQPTDLVVAAQICLPDRAVEFDDVEVRPYSGDAAKIDGEKLKVRRWQASGRPDDLSRAFIAIGEVHSGQQMYGGSSWSA